MTNIPNAEEFARARKLSAERNQGLDEICKKVMERFGKASDLHQFYLMRQRGQGRYVATIFYKRNSDIATNSSLGVTKEIESFVLNELRQRGQESAASVALSLDIDSDENVARNFNGDYFLRMR